jgi:hypothetical protein
MHELRLSHKRVLRQKGREASALQNELTNARAQLRELRIQKRDLQAVCPSCCLLRIVDESKTGTYDFRQAHGRLHVLLFHHMHFKEQRVVCALCPVSNW